MYNMCVIDDMKHVVDSIVQNIEWEKHDIHIIGMATNGEAGMRMIRETEPHIVLTDIRMPRMDGLEMISQVLEFLPQVKIIIMSGYADFEYAQRAIRLGALDFIPKPITPNELIQSVSKAKQELEKEKHGQENMQRLQKQVNESLPLLRQDYFNMLVRYFSTEETAKQRLGTLDVELDKAPFQVFVVEIDRYKQPNKDLSISEVELIRFVVHNILEETIRQFTKGFVFRDYQMNQLIGILNIKPGLDIAEIAERCRAHVEQFSRYTVSIGVGPQVERVDELPVSYEKAVMALSYPVHTEGNHVFFEKNDESHMLINQSIQYMKEHLHLGLTVNDCAKVALMSPSYYASLFKKVTGMTFGQYITQERIEQAKKLLLADMQVQEIALQLGIEDRPYFTELFKRHTGMTPSEFKNKYRT